RARAVRPAGRLSGRGQWRAADRAGAGWQGNGVAASRQRRIHGGRVMVVPNERFGIAQTGRWRSRVVGTMLVADDVECLALLRALEAGLRCQPTDKVLLAKRRELQNMRARAYAEDWSGWS